MTIEKIIDLVNIDTYLNVKNLSKVKQIPNDCENIASLGKLKVYESKKNHLHYVSDMENATKYRCREVLHSQGIGTRF
ncbi:hypothetical protein [Sediminitomix flava]|uniref:hypothetical protein n=1 Tax=Sediminitomix flava TaxID=379075 RepID=UPI000D6BFF2C|nr:hypothetical protein [Sediminitomix flava]